MTNEELIKLIPLKKAKYEDQPPVPYNDGLRTIYRLLKQMRFSEHELRILRAEIMLLSPEWWKKRLAKGKEDGSHE